MTYGRRALYSLAGDAAGMGRDELHTASDSLFPLGKDANKRVRKETTRSDGARRTGGMTLRAPRVATNSEHKWTDACE